MGIALLMLYWAVLGLAACSSTHDDEQPHPEHDHGEHYTSPPGVVDATAPAAALTRALSAIFSWEPVTDTSPTDALRRATPHLTGDALRSAQTPEARSVRTSPEWAGWRTSGDLITARVDSAQATITGPGEAFGRATISQSVLHLGGGSTPYRSFTVTAQLRQIEGNWKLATYPDAE
jgi:Mce-associated membrane protein